MKQALLLCLLSTVSLAKHHKEEEFDWFTFIIGSSCTLETLTSEGEIDEKAASKVCGGCFDPLETATNDETVREVVRNCSATFLPNIATQCGAVLGVDAESDQFWEGVLKCFYEYVEEKDTDGSIQTAVKEWMEHHAKPHDDHDKQKKWEYLLGGSCLAEHRKDDGSFNFEMSEKCGECFQQNEFKTCIERFLPSLTECTSVLYEAGEEAAMMCINTVLEKMDMDGAARKMTKDYLRSKDSWTGWIASMFQVFWSYVLAMFS